MELKDPTSLSKDALELRRLNWALAAFARSSAALMRFTSFEGLAPQICEAIVGDNDYLVATVGLAEAGPTKPIRLFAAAGLAAAYIDGLNLSWSDQVAEGLGPAGQAIRSLQPMIMRDSETDDRFAHWIERANGFGIRSSVTVPFVGVDGAIGIVMVYAGRPDAFGERELDVFAKLGRELGFAMKVQKTRDELTQSEARYRMLADNATDIILQYDSEGRFAYVSPAIRQLGYSPEEVLGLRTGVLVHPDDKDLVVGRFEELRQGRATGSFEARIRRADGEFVWFESNPSLIRNKDGQIAAVITVLRDVSERKAAEEALREVNAELSRVGRVSALSAFGASLAHEINQPLSALVTNCEVARRWLSKDPPDLPKAERAIERGVRDAQRASDIIGRMRAMVTKGHAKVDDFDINDAITEVLALTQAEQQNSNVATAVQLTNSALIIRGDRVQLQQVVLNLIANAIEAMRASPEGERRLLIRSGVMEDGCILVEIEDRGPGLDPAEADRIFDHLFTTKSGGTGLGLSISKSIIESHGGHIWAKSAAPNGAVFCFQLPLSTCNLADVWEA